jgi:hypothetical protein
METKFIIKLLVFSIMVVLWLVYVYRQKTKPIKINNISHSLYFIGMSGIAGTFYDNYYKEVMNYFVISVLIIFIILLFYFLKFMLNKRKSLTY